MRNFGSLLGVVACLLAFTSTVNAEDKATTDELPAALQGIGVDDSRILTTSQAEEVRGESFQLNFIFTFAGGGINVDLRNVGAPITADALVVAGNAGGVLFQLQ